MAKLRNCSHGGRKSRRDVAYASFTSFQSLTLSKLVRFVFISAGCRNVQAHFSVLTIGARP